MKVVNHLTLDKDTILGYPGAPTGITRVPAIEEGGRGEPDKETRRQGGAVLLALRTEQGARSREMHMASRGKKSQRNGFLREPPGRTPTCHHHDFSSVSPVLEFCTDCEIINVCSCKLLSWGKLVTVIIKNSYWGRQRGKGESSYYREEGGGGRIHFVCGVSPSQLGSMPTVTFKKSTLTTV